MNENTNTPMVYEIDKQIETSDIENSDKILSMESKSESQAYKKVSSSLTSLVITEISWHTIRRTLITEVKEVMHYLGMS